MGQCFKCGMPMPGDVSGAVCLNCQRQEAISSARASQKSAARPAKKDEGRIRFWNDKDGNLVREFADGSRTVTTKGEIRRGFWGAVALILAVAVAVVFVLARFVFNAGPRDGAFQGEGTEELAVTAPLGEEETALLAKIRGIVKDAQEYELRVTRPEPNWFVADKIAVVRYFTDETFGDGFTVRFKCLQSDSGLKGEYTLMAYDGETCVFCDKDETVYPPDSAFYKAHYEALAKWDGRAMMTALLDRIRTGEVFEKYAGMYVLKSDKISVFIAEDGSVQLLDETGEKAMFYAFTPADTAKPENYADYKPLGYEDGETDALQKLLNKADYDATLEWYVDGGCVGEMRVTDNGDGSFTFENSYNPTDEVAMGKYVLYPAQKRYSYYKYDNPELYTLSSTPEEHTAQDSPADYQWLCDRIPQDFVRAHLNLDNAKKASLLGLATTYTEERGDGGKAVLEVDITGKVSFEYHAGDGKHLRIWW